jgi:replicative DNA helicase
VLEIRAKARRLQSELRSDKKDLGMVLIDYMQLMSGTQHAESRVQEVSQISRGLKALARELDVPVIALSQLSRGPEQRTDKRPMLSDLRESGSIEQDADVVMFLYRPEYYAPPEKRDELEGKSELIVGKQRNGPTGVIELYFQKAYTRFDSALPAHTTGPRPQEAGPGYLP